MSHFLLQLCRGKVLQSLGYCAACGETRPSKNHRQGPNLLRPSSLRDGAWPSPREWPRAPQRTGRFLRPRTCVQRSETLPSAAWVQPGLCMSGLNVPRNWQREHWGSVSVRGRQHSSVAMTRVFRHQSKRRSLTRWWYSLRRALCWSPETLESVVPISHRPADQGPLAEILGVPGTTGWRESNRAAVSSR